MTKGKLYTSILVNLCSSQVIKLLMFLFFFLCQRSTIDIDYMHIDKKWFQSLSNHGSWLADTVCK